MSQTFAFYHEDGERIVVIPSAGSPLDAIKQLADKMHDLNPDKWSGDPKDYEDDLDNGVWEMYDGPTNGTVKPFLCRIHHPA